MKSWQDIFKSMREATSLVEAQRAGAEATIEAALGPLIDDDQAAMLLEEVCRAHAIVSKNEVHGDAVNEQEVFEILTELGVLSMVISVRSSQIGGDELGKLQVGLCSSWAHAQDDWCPRAAGLTSWVDLLHEERIWKAIMETIQEVCLRVDEVRRLRRISRAVLEYSRGIL